MKKTIVSLLTIIILMLPVVSFASEKNGFIHDDKTNTDIYYENGNIVASKWVKFERNWGPEYYYLKADGTKTLGWAYIDNNWYHFDLVDGKMDYGWFRDTDGNYYYLDINTGIMAHDTSINGFKIGHNGAWLRNF